MDIQHIIDSIKNSLQTGDVTDTSKYSCSRDLLIILQKVNYSDELSTRLFLQTLREILVFGSFILKFESSIHDFKSLNYQDSKEEVCSFVKRILENCDFLPVDYHLWNNIILKLLNKQISPKFAETMALIFTNELRAVSPGLFNEKGQDLLLNNTGSIARTLAVYTRILPQINFIENMHCSLKQQKEWMLFQMLSENPIPDEDSYISSINHFLGGIKLLENSYKSDKFRKNWSGVFSTREFLSHKEYRNLGDWFFHIINSDCQCIEYKLRFIKLLLERRDNTLLSTSPEQDASILKFLQTWFFMAQYYPLILEQGIEKLLEVLVIIARYEMAEPLRIESMDKVITSHYNMSRLHNDIVTHLYVQYETPYWFSKHLLSGNEIDRLCFFHLAKGNNLRYLSGLPYNITRKEAHQMANFTQSQVPAIHYENWFALGLLFARLMVNGCAPELIVSMRQNHWQICRLFNYPGMLDELSAFIIRHQVAWARNNGNGEILDYILHMKQEYEQFSFRSRAFQTLRSQSRRWHTMAAQRRSSFRVPEYWESVRVDDFQLCEDTNTYYITQITSLDRLFEEGNELKHCVYSYARMCASGQTAIFSLNTEDEHGKLKSLVTIQVSNRTIIQARGRCNRSMNNSERRIIRKWAEIEHLRIAV